LPWIWEIERHGAGRLKVDRKRGARTWVLVKKETAPNLQGEVEEGRETYSELGGKEGKGRWLVKSCG